MTNWREISVRVAREKVADIESIFEDNAALAVTVSSAEQTQEIFDLLDQQYRLWRFVEVTGLFAAEEDHKAVVETLAATGVAKAEIETKLIADQDWVLRWQQDQRPLDFGHGLFICAPQLNVPPAAKTVVTLEPGMAFGTGTHPTTAMCLSWIAARPWDAGMRVLDFGCGSGVLAIAASKCGAGRVWGCDIDPQALEVARANAGLNQTTHIPFYLNNDLPDIEADVLIANILLEPLISEKSTIHKHLKTGGVVVLSGILSDQTERLKSAFAPEFALEVICTEQDWALMFGQKRFSTQDVST